MTLEELIISFVRIFASLIVFKFNFFGAILVILIDFSDLFMMNLISLGGVRNYQLLDKFLDLFYIVYFLLITLRWHKILRNISILLFIFRILRFILFEFFQSRIILFIFPNIFEFWFIGITLLFLFRSKIYKRKIIIVIFVSTALKLIQEYILHVWKVLDNYRAVDVFNSFVELF
ncbi:MAG: hypothetical protein GWO78_03035 [Dehalococcoidales bacterium]|nr:hypothetical protein [Dehalococcoidales bacterium]